MAKAALSGVAAMIHALYIYKSGYGPTSRWTLQEWFKARDYVRQNQVEADKFIK